MARSLPDTWILVGWAVLWAGIFISNISKGSKVVFGSLVLLLGFHALAIPGSLIWGNGNWVLTAGVVMWMAPAMLLYLANDAHRVFAWLVPIWLIHSILIIIEGFTKWAWVGDVLVRQGHNTGLANNPNLAAGFLIIGIIYLMSTDRKWLSLPLLMGLMFTGSRWGLVVAGVLLVAMALSGAISWRPLAGAAVTAVATVLLLGLLTPSGYTVAGYDSIAGVANDVTRDVGIRLAVPHIPSFLPSGVAEHSGLHNVPLRIAVENGLLAAGLWVLITAFALIKTPNPECENNRERGRGLADQNKNVHRWILLALVLLSVLDYYTWMGHLGGFWWLLIGLLTKPRPSSAGASP